MPHIYMYVYSVRSTTVKNPMNDIIGTFEIYNVTECDQMLSVCLFPRQPRKI